MRVLLVVLLLVCSSLCSATPTSTRLPAQGTVEVLFTPWDDAEGALVRALAEARKTIHVQAYLLTSRAIAEALLAAWERGVAVAVLADSEMVTKGDKSQIPRLAEAGVPVWLETRYAVAHNKLLLIDAASPAPTIATGSYNYTWSAQARNAENLLLLRDNPALARRYLENWRRHQTEAQPWSERNQADAK